MNILIAVDSNYIVPAKVMLKRLSIHLSEKLDIYLLYSSLREKHNEDLSRFCMKECGAELHPMYVERKTFNEMPLTGWFSVEVYFRLIAPFILPENIKRILWIDADIIIKKIYLIYTIQILTMLQLALFRIWDQEIWFQNAVSAYN